MALVQFSGLASGIDSQSLIKAILTQQRQTRIVPLQDKNTELEETGSALKELKTLLTTLKSKADKFRSLNGGIIAKLANSSDESVLTASANNSAVSGSYNLSISQLAKNSTATLASQNQTYTSQASVINSAIVGSGQVNVTVGLGSEQESIDIDLDNSTTLDQFVTNYNNQATKSNATLVNVGTSSIPNYQIMISSNSQGTEKGTVQITVDPTVSGAGVGAFDDNTLSQARNAEFTMDGVGGTITRSSNVINDLISGVTFNLKGTGSSTVAINNDNTASTKNMNEFIEAYNAIVEFIRENDTVSIQSGEEGNTNIFGPLAKTSLDDSILSSLRQSFSSSALSSGTIRTLADLGITTKRDGSVEFDKSVFESALDSSSSGVNQLLENLGETLASVNGVIDQFTRFNGLIDVTNNSQTDMIKRNNDRISILEQHLAKQEQALTARFSRLEGLVGKMQSQQSALGSLLQSL